VTGRQAANSAAAGAKHTDLQLQQDTGCHCCIQTAISVLPHLLAGCACRACLQDAACEAGQVAQQRTEARQAQRRPDGSRGGSGGAATHMAQLRSVTSLDNR
jgi:hypothetical protein